MLKKLSVIIALFISIYIILIAYNFIQAYQIRSNTDQLVLSKFFESTYKPHNLVPRIVLYIPGSDEYNLDILRKSKNKESKIDCYFINNLIKSTDDKKLLDNINELFKYNFGKCIASSYFLDQRININKIIEDQEQIDDFWKKLDIEKVIEKVTKKIPRKEIEYFLLKNIEEKKHKAFSILTPEVSSRNTEINYTDIYMQHKTLMSEQENRKFLRNISLKINQKSINHIKNIYDENKKIPKELEDEMIFSLFYKSRKRPSWIMKKLRDIEPDHYFIEKFYYQNKKNTPSENHGLSYLLEISKILDKENSFVASQIHHSITHAIESQDKDKNIEKAKYYLNQIISSKDNNELKKNMIVISTRHPHANIPYLSIDDAFSGDLPRRFHFTGYQYMIDSIALKEYEEISEHNYTFNGERHIVWPLSSYKETTSKKLAQKVLLWKEFIKKYPSHPGIDDAYLRLAFDLYNLGHYKESIEEIEEYFSRKVNMDTSAEKRIKALLGHAVLKVDEVETMSINIKNIKSLYELPLIEKEHSTPLALNREQKEFLEQATFLTKKEIDRVYDISTLSKKEIIMQARKNNTDRAIILSLLFKTPSDDMYACVYDKKCDELKTEEPCYTDDYQCTLSHPPVYLNQ